MNIESIERGIVKATLTGDDCRLLAGVCRVALGMTQYLDLVQLDALVETMEAALTAAALAVDAQTGESEVEE